MAQSPHRLGDPDRTSSNTIDNSDNVTPTSGPDRIPPLRSQSSASELGNRNRSFSNSFARLRATPSNTRIDSILDAARRRSEAIETLAPQPLRRSSTLRITAEQAQQLRDAEEQRDRATREAEEPENTVERVGQVRDGGRGMDDSADERTRLNSQDRHVSYGAAGRDSGSPKSLRGIQSESPSGPRRRNNAQLQRQAAADAHIGTDDVPLEGAGWWRRTVEKYGSLELENKGSVARDHLALERTFLAWLRTSLAFASIGIAITQLFRLNTSLANSPETHDQFMHFRSLGKPLGATFVAISIVVLFTGFHRYFESQHWIIRGKFPASRGSVALIALIAFLLMVVSLIIVLTVEPRGFEKR